MKQAKAEASDTIQLAFFSQRRTKKDAFRFTAVFLFFFRTMACLPLLQPRFGGGKPRPQASEVTRCSSVGPPISKHDVTPTLRRHRSKAVSLH